MVYTDDEPLLLKLQNQPTIFARKSFRRICSLLYRVKRRIPDGLVASIVLSALATAINARGSEGSETSIRRASVARLVNEF